jgi:uncharacterized oligopeptide transporter (OPT) family protein
MAVPMRRQMIDVDRLRFPSGTACAETIRSMHQSAAEAVAKARALLVGGLLAVVFEIPAQITKFGARANPLHWGEHLSFAGITLAGKKLASYTVSLNTSLLMYGAGAIMGIRVGLSLAVGALILYCGLAPWLDGHGIVVITDDGQGGQTYRSVLSWAVWPGVVGALAASLLHFALKWRSIAQAFGSLGKLAKGGTGPSRMSVVEVPPSWFGWGMALATAFVALAGKIVFDIPLWMSVLATALSSSCRSWRAVPRARLT